MLVVKMKDSKSHQIIVLLYDTCLSCNKHFNEINEIINITTISI